MSPFSARQWRETANPSTSTNVECFSHFVNLKHFQTENVFEMFSKKRRVAAFIGGVPEDVQFVRRGSGQCDQSGGITVESPYHPAAGSLFVFRPD